MNDITQINTNQRPFIVITILSQLITEEEINFFFKKITEFYKNNQGKNLIIIYDLTKLKAIGTNGRKMIGEWIGENTQLIDSAVAGICYLSKNIAHKIILEGIFTYNKSKSPSKSITSLEEGFEWGKQILEKKNIITNTKYISKKMKKIIKTTKAPQAIGPYSQAVETNGTLYVSGQVPIVPATSKVIDGGITEQTEQVMQNISAILEAADYKFTDVVKSTVLLSDIKNFAAMNEVYGKYYKENPPARAAYEVANLPLGVLVEIETIAVK